METTPGMGAGTPMRRSPVGVFLAMPLFASCAAPVRIVRQSPQKVHREITANVLSAGRMSAATRARNRSALAQADVEQVPTSVDNMSGDSPFVKTLAEMSTVPDVHAHSIVAVSGVGPLADDGDGVVKYTSAHREDVESELLVISGHSAQSNPQVIEEVRRILRVHSEQEAATGACP
jgi:hypothetical protein